MRRQETLLFPVLHNISGYQTLKHWITPERSIISHDTSFSGTTGKMLILWKGLGGTFHIQRWLKLGKHPKGVNIKMRPKYKVLIVVSQVNIFSQNIYYSVTQSWYRQETRYTLFLGFSVQWHSVVNLSRKYLTVQLTRISVFLLGCYVIHPRILVIMWLIIRKSIRIQHKSMMRMF